MPCYSLFTCIPLLLVLFIAYWALCCTSSKSIDWTNRLKIFWYLLIRFCLLVGHAPMCRIIFSRCSLVLSHTPLSSPIRATYPAHLILLDFITRTILGEDFKSFSSSLCSLLHSPVTSSLLGSNILLNTMFSNTLTEFTTIYYSPLLQMLWLDVCARHAECQTCTSLRKYKQNPTNRSGATLTWLPVSVGPYKHFLTHLLVCHKLCLSIRERGCFCLLS